MGSMAVTSNDHANLCRALDMARQNADRMFVQARDMGEANVYLRGEVERLTGLVGVYMRDEPRAQLLEELAAAKAEAAALRTENAKLQLALDGTREQLGALVAVHG